MMACRVAGACEHVEHAAKPEIGVAIPPRVFRHRVLVASSQHSSFEPRSGCRYESAARRAGIDRERAKTISRHAERRQRDGMPSSTCTAPTTARTYRAHATKIDSGGRIALSSVVLRTVVLSTASNVFMTFAWYAHLRNLSDRPWYIAAIVSWGIALFEYLLQVPANRIGFEMLSLALLYMRQPVNWNFVWAGCSLLRAVDFVFK
jgi:uncharacterized protein (DUF486 family)